MFVISDVCAVYNTIKALLSKIYVAYIKLF